MSRKIFLFLIILLSTLTTSLSYAEDSNVNPPTHRIKVKFASFNKSKVKLASSEKTNNKAYDALLEMQRNIKELDYTLIFTSSNETDSITYSYTNIFKDNKRYGQLKNLDGDKSSVILKDGFVVYSIYTIKSNNISDVFPAVFNADFEQLKETYIFTLGGNERVADRDGMVIDITNKYSNLFSYQVILDKQTYLPLKITLVEHELANNSFIIIKTFSASKLEENYNNDVYKQILSTKINENVVYESKVDPQLIEDFDSLVNFGYIPSGFKLVSTNSFKMKGNSLVPGASSNNDKEIDYYSMTYFDGLFNFTLFISKEEVDINEHYYLRSSDLSFYTETYANHKLIILGQIPLNIAKGIINTLDIYDSNGNILNLSHKDGFGTRIELE